MNLESCHKRKQGAYILNLYYNFGASEIVPIEIGKNTRKWMEINIYFNGLRINDTLYREKDKIKGKFSITSGLNQVEIDGTIKKDGINKFYFEGDFIKSSHSQAFGWTKMSGKFTISR